MSSAHPPTTASTSVGRMRSALLALSLAVALGVMVQLALLGHWQQRTKLVPLASVAGSGVLAVLLVGRRNARPHRLVDAVQVWTLVAVAAGWWGVNRHLVANLATVREQQPGWDRRRLFVEAARGDLPLLAPLAVVIPALLLVVASWPDRVTRPSPTGPDHAGDSEPRRALDLSRSFSAVRNDVSAVLRPPSSARGDAAAGASTEHVDRAGDDEGDRGQ